MDKPAMAGVKDPLPKTARRDAMNVITPPSTSRRTLSQLERRGIVDESLIIYLKILKKQLYLNHTQLKTKMPNYVIFSLIHYSL